jgi:hypothetical protein
MVSSQETRVERDPSCYHLTSAWTVDSVELRVSYCLRHSLIKCLIFPCFPSSGNKQPCGWVGLMFLFLLLLFPLTCAALHLSLCFPTSAVTGNWTSYHRCMEKGVYNMCFISKLCNVSWCNVCRSCHTRYLFFFFLSLSFFFFKDLKICRIVMKILFSGVIPCILVGGYQSLKCTSIL